MKLYIYFIILIFLISCSKNKGVYWCGDHACANNKEKEAYFEKTMIVEVRNLDKNKTESDSINEKIINQSKSSNKKKFFSRKKKLDQEIKLEVQENIRNEKEIEEQIKIQEQIEHQEQDRLKQEKELKEQGKLEDEKRLIMKKEEQQSSSAFAKVVEIKEISTKNFDELVERILIRNSSRTYPKINDIPK